MFSQVRKKEELVGIAVRSLEAVLAVLTVLSFLKGIWISLDMDESYAAALGYRMAAGDRLIRDMWEPHQFSGFLAALFTAVYVRIWSSTEYLIVYLRVVGVLIHTGLGIALYRQLRKELKQFSAYGILILHLNFLPKWVQMPEFELMHYWCLLGIFIVLHAYFTGEKNRMLYPAAGGFLLVCSILCYPTMILLYPFYILALYVLERQRIRSRQGWKTLWRSSIFFTLGAILSGGAFLVYLFSYMSFEELKRYVSYIFLDTSHGVYTMGEKWGMYLEQMVVQAESYGRYLLLGAALTLAAGVVWGLCSRRSGAGAGGSEGVGMLRAGSGHCGGGAGAGRSEGAGMLRAGSGNCGGGAGAGEPGGAGSGNCSDESRSGKIGMPGSERDSKSRSGVGRAAAAWAGRWALGALVWAGILMQAKALYGFLLEDKNQFYFQVRYMALLLPGIVLGVRRHREMARWLYLLVVPGIVSVPLVLFVTNMDTNVTYAKAFAGVLGSLLILDRYCEELVEGTVWKRAVSLLRYAAGGALLAGLLVCRLVLIRVSGCLPVTVNASLERMESGPEKGIWVLADTAEVWNENYRDLEQHIRQEDKVLYIGAESLAYVKMGAVAATPSTQGTTVFNDMFLYYYEEHPDRIPDVIVYDKTFGVNPAYGLSYVLSLQEPVLFQWIEQNYGSAQIIETAHLIILRREG